MKFVLNLFLILFFSLHSIAQITEAFDKYEARDMIALCNSFTQINLFNTDSDIVPKNYHKIYTSGVYGLDNKFQIWKKGGVAVIVFRGSTAKQISWLENMYSVMIPVKGQIVLPGMDTVNYQLAVDNQAKIHAGWTLGLLFMSQDLVHEIQLVNAQGISRIIIAGHSQGAALALLARAYLENLPKGVINKETQFKTYAFASPMVGNKAFVDEYRNRYKLVYSFYNPKDMVPKMPFTVQNSQGSIYTWENLEKILDSTDNVTIKSLALQAFTNTVSKDPVASYMKMAGDDVLTKIIKETGPIQMPPYSRDLNYLPMNDRIVLGPFDELVEHMTFGNENSENKTPETLAYQHRLISLRGGKAYKHKPYNYYLYFLKKYFEEDYVRIIAKERYQWNRP